MMKTQFEDFLQECLTMDYSSDLVEAMKYSLLAVSKRLRPLLCLAVVSDYGQPIDFALEAAAAVEMIHTYSLIHDDLPAMDDDDYRRGQLTNHKKYGEATAILAGDALLTLAFELLSTSNYDDVTKIQCMKVLAKSSGVKGMILGQFMDMQAEEQILSWDSLLQMYMLKTGQLFSAALVMGAIVAKQEQDINIWQRIGENLGIAFQIQDDILEIEQPIESLGKSSSDVKNKKKTVVSMIGMEKAKLKMAVIYQDICDDIEQLNLKGQEVLKVIDYIIHRQT